jgi:holin-like protein
MIPPNPIGSVRSLVRRSRLLQIALLIAFCRLGDLAAGATGLPIPGGIIGMLLVLALLSTRKLSLPTMRRGAEWFLAEMLLFFIPAVLSILDHRELLGLLGVKILIVIAVGTLAVMTSTAFTVDLCYRWRSKRDADRAILE